MLRKCISVGVLLMLVTTVAVAQLNRDRVIQVAVTEAAQIGICQPETDMSAIGWNKNPASGYWGGAPVGSFAVAWENNGSDTVALAGGRLAECKINGVNGKVPTQIRIRHLEGQAVDNFCVFASIGAGDLLVGCINETNLGEYWRLSTITLPLNVFASGQDVKVTILAAGNSWSGFGTYGQLAVDYIEVIGQ